MSEEYPMNIFYNTVPFILFTLII
ncbi:unnamed protein product, partial [Rotaria sp. Silwood1]